jgi:protein-tyrosine phosphatase
MRSTDRFLDWEGCFNARDLGGLRTVQGARTRRGAIVRSDALDHLTAKGWQSLLDHGVRTVIDLRNDDEIGSSPLRPSGVGVVRVPVDGIEDRAFWDVWSAGWEFDTPLYYRPHLERFPDRHARGISAIARAAPGGVVFHCSVGRDRSGLVAMLLLALAGVSDDDIASDYALSATRLAPLFARRGEDDPAAEIEEFLRSRGLTLEQSMLSALSLLDAQAVLRAGGLDDAELGALRARLVEH